MHNRGIMMNAIMKLVPNKLTEIDWDEGQSLFNKIKPQQAVFNNAILVAEASRITTLETEYKFAAWMNHAKTEVKHSDNKFGALLIEHDIEVSKDDSAAYVWAGGVEFSEILVLAERFKQTKTLRGLYRNINNKKRKTIANDKPRTETVSPVSQSGETVIQPIEAVQVPESEKQQNTKYLGLNDLAVCKKHYTASCTLSTINKLPKDKIKTLANHIRNHVKYPANGLPGKHSKLSARHIFYDYPKFVRLSFLQGDCIIDEIQKIQEHHSRCGDDLSFENVKAVSLLMKEEASANRPSIEEIHAKLKAQSKSNDAPYVHNDYRYQREDLITGGALPLDLLKDKHQDIIICGQVVWSDSDKLPTINYLDAWKMANFFRTYEQSTAKNDSVKDICRRTSGIVGGYNRYLFGLVHTAVAEFWLSCCHAQSQNPEQYDDTSLCGGYAPGEANHLYIKYIEKTG